MADGWGVKRLDVMYNDFVLVGPQSDPASVARLSDAEEAFKRIAAAKATFASRGDDSGTHLVEREIWAAAGIAFGATRPTWYRELGQGMGPTLNVAAQLPAYTLADRGTWISFKNRGQLRLLVEGDRRLFNQYGVILVNPAKHPHVKAEWGQRFIDWLVSGAGQAAIADFKIDGEPLFFPNAAPKRSS